MNWLRWTMLVIGCLCSPQAWSFDHEHAHFSALLAEHVAWNSKGTTTTVDYAGLRRERSDLGAYLESLSAVEMRTYSTWSREQRLAFLINAYNAWTLALIVDADPEPASIRDLGSWLRSPWKRRFFRLLGEQRSLDDIEHGLIRGAPDYDEPRIHFAVNCASISCPALRDEAYTAESLTAQLDDQTRRFLRDRTRNRFDAPSRTLHLSSIFKWYGKDFERPHRGGNSLLDFLDSYADELGLGTVEQPALREGELRITFLPYDWSLNATQH